MDLQEGIVSKMVTSISSRYYATAYPEAFPSVQTLQKLVRCDELIIADNLLYNKRDKINQITFKDDIFSIPVAHKKENYSSLEFSKQSNWQRKLIRLIDDHFYQSTVYYFHQHELHNIIKSATNYLDLSLNLLLFSKRVMKQNCTIKMASSFSIQFDLIKIISKSDGTYLVESKYEHYLKKNMIKQFKTIQLMAKNNKLNTDSSFDLLMEFGHHLPNLILGF